jgi:ubiquitin carboxyl-terminal hydrolase 47
MREGFQQHDVQEFCRVLFDAIEESCKETPLENMINELYEGRMYDFVKCCVCEYESRREDKFLDLSLTIRNDFDQIYNSSV